MTLAPIALKVDAGYGPRGKGAPHFEHTARLMRSIDRAVQLAGANMAAMPAYRSQMNGQRIDSMLTQMTGRRDSFSANQGLAMARQLEHVYADVLREEYPMKNAFTAFPIDTSVAPGNRTHTVRRIYQSGEAAVYRAGEEIPRVGISQAEEQFPIRHYVTSFVFDIFERMATGRINISLAAELLRVARDVMDEFANLMTFFGDDANGIYGVLNYPWLDKFVMGVTAGGSLADDAARQAMVNAFLELLDYPQDNTLSTFSPNTLATSGRVIRFLKRERFEDGSGDTLYDRIVDSDKINTIEEFRELQGTGPGGTDGVLAYRRDRLGIANVIVQPFTTLPVQEFGFEEFTYAYMSHGGVIMRNVANNILGWIEFSAS